MNLRELLPGDQFLDSCGCRVELVSHGHHGGLNSQIKLLKKCVGEFCVNQGRSAGQTDHWAGSYQQFTIDHVENALKRIED